MNTIRACVTLCLLVLGSVLSCPSPSYLRRQGGRNLCARMYQHHECSGDYLNAYKRTYRSNVGGYWNDKITSFVVLPGCELQVYEHHYYNGARAVYGHYNRYGQVVSNIGRYWNDKITSFICTCRNYKK